MIYRQRPFFLMAKVAARDVNLSWAARGLLAYLGSFDDEELVDLQEDEATSQLVDELKDRGYITVVGDGWKINDAIAEPRS